MRKNIINIIFLALLIFVFGSCKDSNGKSIFEPTRVEPPKMDNKEENVSSDNVGRSSWQKPELVLNKLGDLGGKTIADIGTGTGYFTVMLAYKNANVIAIDIDPDMLSYIDSYKKNLPEEVQDNISTRLAMPDNPMLEDKEVDKVIIINTASYIDQLEDYLVVLKKGIKSKGSLMILDYKNKIIDIPAPPLDDRISIGRLQTYLANAGYKNIIVDDTSLEYQYIVSAEVE